MAIANSGRFIVRAEIHSPSGRVVSHGFDLTESSIFVVTEWHAAIGTPVTVRLSFPKILEPTDVPARIGGIRAAGEPGEPGGIRLVFDTCSRDIREKIAALLERVNAPITATAAKHRPCRVLIVDDSWLIRDMFTYGTAKFFPSGAIAVDHAEDAEDARVKLAMWTYDLVIIDYFLPTENGALLIAQLRSDARLSHTPIVAISVGGRAAREATLSAGADVFIDKPLIFRDVFNTLRMLAV